MSQVLNLDTSKVIEIKAPNQEVLSENLESNLDKGKSAPTCNQAFEKGQLEGISNEFSTIEDSHSTNKTLKEGENVDKNILLNMQENNVWNINFSKSFENENAEVLISRSKESKEENIRCVEDIAAIPGPSSEETIKCSACKKELAQHVILNEGMDAYKCCLCGNIFRLLHHLRQHIDILGPDPFHCQTCGQAFIKMCSHSNKQTCKICQETFQCRTSLVEHSITHREHCVLCWTEIDDHISQYIGGILYKCCKCELKIIRRANMWRHFYTHLDEKAFSCDVCNQRYSTLGDLSAHKKTHK